MSALFFLIVIWGSASFSVGPFQSLAACENARSIVRERMLGYREAEIERAVRCVPDR